MSDTETQNMERVVAEGVEVGVREREDDAQSRGGNVSEDYGPENRNAPVLALSDDLVEVTAQLVALESG